MFFATLDYLREQGLSPVDYAHWDRNGTSSSVSGPLSAEESSEIRQFQSRGRFSVLWSPFSRSRDNGLQEFQYSLSSRWGENLAAHWSTSAGLISFSPLYRVVLDCSLVVT